MKKTKSLFSLILLIIVSLIFLLGCNRTYSFFDATGINIKDIEDAKASRGVGQSYTSPMDKEDYQYLNIKYIKVDFNIEEEYLYEWPSGKDAYCLWISSSKIDNRPGDNSFIFYIDHETHYMYFYGKDYCYRSKNKVSNKFINDVFGVSK